MICLILLCLLLATSIEAFRPHSSINNETRPPTVVWYAPFLSGGGYCSEAHSYVVAVDAALRLSALTRVSSSRNTGNQEKYEARQDTETSVPFEHPFELLITQHGDSMNPLFIQDLPIDMKTKLEQHWIEEKDFFWRFKQKKVSLAICHSEPGAWEPAHYMTSHCPPKGALYKVGRTMFETDRVPKGWPERMNKMDEIWVPTKFQKKIFVDGGVRPEAIKIVPEVVDVDFFDPKKVEKVYDLVFSAQDDVVLVLLTNGYHSTSSSTEDFMHIIEKFAMEAVSKPLKELPNVHVLPPHIPQELMPSLYKAAKAFVLPSRGEGWGRPHVEAMAMERPVIATFWSGTTEYMTKENSYPLDIDRLVEITEGAFQGHMWADPSVKHLKELLLWVKEHPEEAVAKGKQARKDMVDKYSPEKIGKVVLGHITRILEHVGTREEAAKANDVHEEL